MKVICPYVELRADTYRALTAQRPRHDIRFIYVGGSDTAYAELLAEEWAIGETFAICEHDVVPRPDSLDELERCAYRYCAFPVALQLYVAPCLSLTKFDAQLLELYPDAMERVLRVPTNYGPPGHWRQLDTVLQRTVLLNRYGRQVHCHLPAVEHLNETKRQLVPGAPLRTFVHAQPALTEPAGGIDS